MGRLHDAIDDKMAKFLCSQPVFFVATAPLSGEGTVNCSPKGNRDEFAILDPKTVAYLDQTGSGIETIAHLKENGRITLMFCAFTGPAKIVRIQGTGTVLTPGEHRFGEVLARFPGGKTVGTRAIIVVALNRLSDSCGTAVPFLEFVGHRDALDKWAEHKGPDGIEQYWIDHNQLSIDGLPGLLDPNAAEQPV